MDAREGQLDWLSGQRAAFPLDGDDSSAAQYLRGVRREAEQLAVAAALSRKRPHDDVQRADAAAAAAGGAGDATSTNARAARPAPDAGAGLDYDAPPDAAQIRSLTAGLFGGAARLDAAARGDVVAVYEAARSALAALAPEHPAECTSLATWKAYTTQHAPVPLGHVDTFRVYRYLAKWLASRFEDAHAVWAWSLLLRTPSVLTGDEMALLRDVARALALAPARASAAARAFVLIVGTQFGQRDLLEDSS